MGRPKPWLRKVLEDAKFAYNQRLDFMNSYTTAENLVFVPFPDNNPYLTAQNGAWINPETQRIEWNWCGLKCVGYTIKTIDKTADKT